MARMEADLEIDAGRAVVSLGGALDVSNAHRFGALLRRLVHEGCTEIVVDLSTASSIDASGIGILRGAAKAVERRTKGRLRFKNAPVDLTTVLVDSGLVEATSDQGEAGAGAPISSPVTNPPKRAREPQPPSPRQPGRTTRSRVPRP